ncbi:MAG: hypothetical protein QNJ81_00575 [Acidimicrobiia bacterium]|nr:hypothetical protein [Acidimicrobiia bacterium]
MLQNGSSGKGVTRLQKRLAATGPAANAVVDAAVTAALETLSDFGDAPASVWR